VLHDFDAKTAEATGGHYVYATSVSRTKGGPCHQDLWNHYAKAGEYAGSYFLRLVITGDET